MHRTKKLKNKQKKNQKNIQRGGIRTKGTKKSQSLHQTQNLYTSVIEGNLENVKKLLADPKIDVNQASMNGETPLYGALNDDENHGKEMEIFNLLMTVPGIDVNKPNIDGNTPLYIAVYRGKDEMVQKLLEAPGIDVNKANEKEESPLFEARDIDIMKMLLAAPGINVKKINKDGNTPLMAMEILMESRPYNRNIEKIVALLKAAEATKTKTKSQNGGRKVKKTLNKRRKTIKTRKY